MDYTELKEIRENPSYKDVDNKKISSLINEAIDKQIGKKPYIDETTLQSSKPLVRCPRCNQELILRIESYCFNCGQRLREEERIERNDVKW